MVVGAVQAETITAEAHNKMRSVNVSGFNEDQFLLVGQIVALRFNHRHAEMREVKPGFIECRFGGQIIGAINAVDNAHVKVWVPAEGLKWLQTVTTRTDSMESYSVYGEAMKDNHGHIYLRLIGRNIHMQMTGGGEITW